MRRVGQIAAAELRLIVREPSMAIAYTLMPLALIAVVNQAFADWMLGQSIRLVEPSGAEMSVGGISAVFSIILLANFGLFFYRDHSTGVWDRMRASYARPYEIIAGKLAATWLLHFVQYVGLVLFAFAVYDLPLDRHVVGVTAMIAATITATVALGFAMFAVFSSSNSFEATAIAGGLTLGALGGCFSPRELLPSWSNPFQPASPVTWTVSGFRSLFQPGYKGFGVLVSCGVLLGFACGFFLLGCLLFDPDTPKSKTR